MIAIDSSAVVAILSMETDGPKLLWVLSNARGRVMSAMSFLETSLVLTRRAGNSGHWEALDAFVEEAKIALAPFDEAQAGIARAAFLKYGKGRHPAALNFGDCAAYALAKSRNIPLLYKGAVFAKTDIVSAL